MLNKPPKYAFHVDKSKEYRDFIAASEILLIFIASILCVVHLNSYR